MDRLEELESQSVYILREAYREFKQLVMLWSIGKDSTVLLWLARKAFFGHVPIPLYLLLPMCVGALLSTPLSAITLRRLPPWLTKRVMAVAIIALGVYALLNGKGI